MVNDDGMLSRFLNNQIDPAMELAAASDILDLQIIDSQHYIARFHCATLIGDGRTPPVVRELTTTVGVFLPSDYLDNEPSSGLVFTCLMPLDHYHPNIRGRMICIGDIRRGEPLTDLLYRTYEVISYQNYATLEWNCLQPTACSWARRNAERLPIDPRPLKRRPAERPTPLTGAEAQPS